MKVGLCSLFLAPTHRAITPIAGSATKRTAKLPHNGAVIHHHDQSITPQSFRIRNTRNSNVGKPIDEFEFAILFLFKVFYYGFCNPYSHIADFIVVVAVALYHLHGEVFGEVGFISLPIHSHIVNRYLVCVVFFGV